MPLPSLRDRSIFCFSEMTPRDPPNSFRVGKTLARPRQWGFETFSITLDLPGGDVAEIELTTIDNNLSSLVHIIRLP